MEAKYKRVLLKISGEALAGEDHGSCNSGLHGNASNGDECYGTAGCI